jgi:hypothetical protein
VTSPFGPLVLIVNPRAGRGQVDEALPQVENVLRVWTENGNTSRW